VRGIFLVLRRGIAARRARTLVVCLAVAAAVAFLTSTYVLTDTINTSVQTSAATASGGPSAVVTDANSASRSLLGGLPDLPASLVSRVRQVPGVAAAQGMAVGYATPLDIHGHAISSSASLGVSVPADSRLRVLTLRSGRWPQGAGQVVVDATTAGKLGLRAGSALRVGLPGGSRMFTVAGIAGFGSAASLAGATIVGFAPSAAASLLGTGGNFAAIEVAGTPGTSATDLAAHIKAAIGGGYTVRTSAQQADQLASTIASYSNVIGTLLRVFAIIALLVAALLIANTFTITVAQRTRELALLRCVGAGRGQTAWLVLAEGAVVGLLGGVIGLFGGIGLAVGLRSILGSVGLPLPSTPPVVSTQTVVVSLVVGIGVTVVAAFVAALRASRSRPLAALTGTETAASAGPLGWGRRIIGAFVMLLGAFLLVSAAKRATVAFGAVLLLAGLGLTGPLLVRPLTAPARGVQSAFGGISARLAGRQVLRNPRRVAGTAGTLAVAVATVTIIAAMAATVTSSSALGVSRSMRAGYIITTPPRAGLTPALTSHIAHAPGVTQVVGMPCAAFSPPGGSETVCGTDPATLPTFADIGVTSGNLADLAPGTIAISNAAAQAKNWRVGQEIPVSYPVGGSQNERIVAIFKYDQVAGDYLIPLAAYTRDFPPAQQTDRTVLVNAASGAQQQVHSELSALLTGYPQATLNDKAGYSSKVSSGINFLATLMTGLLAVSLLIGLIAVITALALSVLERTREIGLLRAVGAETRQVRAIVRAEALTTVVTGTLTGLIVGLAIGWPLALATQGGVLGSPAIPGPLLAAVLPAAIIAGLLAAAIPARRAARLNVLAALYTV
jgi:putative ABC transport system permease protein